MKTEIIQKKKEKAEPHPSWSESGGETAKRSFLSSSWWGGKAWLDHVEGLCGGGKRAASVVPLLGGVSAAQEEGGWDRFSGTNPVTHPFPSAKDISCHTAPRTTISLPEKTARGRRELRFFTRDVALITPLHTCDSVHILQTWLLWNQKALWYDIPPQRHLIKTSFIFISLCHWTHGLFGSPRRCVKAFNKLISHM